MREVLTKIYKLDLTISFASLLVAFVVASLIKLHVVTNLSLLTFFFLCFVVYVVFKQMLFVYFQQELKSNTEEITEQFNKTADKLLKNLNNYTEKE